MDCGALLRHTPEHAWAVNALLDPLNSSERQELGRHASRSSFSPGATVSEAGVTARRCLFVESGVVAVLVEGARSGVEVGTVGPDGLLGISVLFGVNGAAHTAVARTRVEGFWVDQSVLDSMARESPAFRDALLRFAYTRMEETMRLCGCNARHTVEQRLARWILTACGTTRDEVRVTHDDLAGALGVRRASVTLCLHRLEGKLAVRSRRGRIMLRDRGVLESLSCGCHRSSAASESWEPARSAQQ